MTHNFTHGMPEDPHLKDNRDYLGADENNTDVEQGVIAVAVCGLVAWLASEWLAFAIGLSLAWLAFRIVTGRITPAALWARILAFPGKLNRIRERLHVKIVVKMLPEDVTDAEDLKGRLFHSPPANLDHQHYRDTFAILALTDRTPEQDLQLAQYLRGLKEYGEDPLRMMAAQMKRRIAPSTKPTPQPLAGVQGIASLPIPGIGWLSQYLMVALVIVGGFAVWQFDRANDNAAKAKSAREDARSWQQAALDNANNAQEQARRRAEEAAMARAELEKTRELAATAQGRAKRLAAREKQRNEEALSGAPVDLDSRLRGIAEPAAADGPSGPGAGENSPAG